MLFILRTQPLPLGLNVHTSQASAGSVLAGL